MDGRGRAFVAFASRDFRLLWAGQTVSLVGDAAFFVALGWLTCSLSGSGALGVVLMLQTLGLLATLLLGGALADRYPRRALMVASDLARGTLVTGLVVAEAAEAISVPLLGAVGALDAASFGVSALLVWLARTRPVERGEAAGALREILTGIRYVASVPWLWVTIALFSVPDDRARAGAGADAGAGRAALRPRRRRRRPAVEVPGRRHGGRHADVRPPRPAPPARRAQLRAVDGERVPRRRARALALGVWETMSMAGVPWPLPARVVSVDYFGSIALMPLGLALAAAAFALASPELLMAAGACLSALMFAAALPSRWLRAVD